MIDLGTDAQAQGMSEHAFQAAKLNRSATAMRIGKTF
jgi:hypothetical protein